MPYSIDPKTSGEGIHRFLIGTAILEAINDRHDEIRFSTSVETATMVAADLIDDHLEWWNQAMAKALLDDEGRPIYGKDGKLLREDADIPKLSRQRQLGALMILARKSGTFSRKKTPYDKASKDFFSKQAGDSSANSESTSGEEEEEEES